MLADYTIDPSRKLILGTWSGRFTLPEIEAAIMKLRRMPDFREDYHRLYNLLDMPVPEVSPSIVSWVRFIDPMFPGTRRGVVTTSAALRVGVGMFRALSGFSSEQMGIFENFEEALDWVLRD